MTTDYSTRPATPCPNWCFYRGTAAEDILIAGWWHRMEADGDLATVFASGSRTMSELFRLMVSPGRAFMYQFDHQGLWIALWVEPLLGGLMTGFWIRPDWRRTRVAGWEFLCAMDLITASGIVVGVTKQREIVRLHQKFGYTVVGEIPGFFDGEVAIILMLTHDKLLEAKHRLRWLNPDYHRGERTVHADEVLV